MTGSFEDYLRTTSRGALRRNGDFVALVARADRDFSDIAGYPDLTACRKLRLFAALIQAKSHFDILEGINTIPSGQAVAAALDKIAQGVGRIAAPQATRALRVLEDAGERWAHQERQAGRNLPNGFPPTADGPHYGAAAFIENFLESARVVKAWIAETRSAPSMGAGGTPVTFEKNSPTQWIYGERLPKIYSRIFGRTFKATIWGRRLSNNSDGVRFVRAAGIALDLPAVEFETIRSHWKNAQKAHP